MKDHDLNFLELVQSSLKNVDECDIYQVNAMLEENREFYLIDVREDREWVQGIYCCTNYRKRTAIMDGW